jgi:hypothetical protein
MKKTLTCPYGTYISNIDFASFGTPVGKCGSYEQSQCHAKDSLEIISSLCVGKVQCALSASNNIFGGDPCVDVSKRLTVQATCTLLPEVINSRVPYQMTVAITDGHGAVAENKVSIFIKDVNEAPVVESSILTVKENSDKGTLIGSPVVASDPDEGDILSYNLFGGDQVENFQMNTQTGQLSLLGRLDYERKSKYILTIKVIDNGNPRRTTLANLNVYVEDLNERPYIGAHNISVNEDKRVGQYVGTHIGYDVDSMDLLSYSVVSGDIYGYFKIDMKDGKLYVRKVLNFESPENKFKIVVDVTDLGGLKDSALCAIDIRDVNEAPQFDLDASFVRYIIEDDYSGAFNSYREVDGGVVQAFDPDYDNNITYTIDESRGSDDKGIFQIGTLDGKIVAKGGMEIDYEELPRHQKYFELWVVATDDRGLQDAVLVTILVQDINEPPVVADKFFGCG